MASFKQWPPVPIGKFGVAFIWLFLIVWFLFMTISLTGGACGKPSIEAEKRIKYCNISIGIWSQILPWIEGHKAARTYISRALIHVELGEFPKAKKDMRTALELASFGQPRKALEELINPKPVSPIILNPPRADPWVPGLIGRMTSPDVPQKAKQIWNEVMLEALSEPEN